MAVAAAGIAIALGLALPAFAAAAHGPDLRITHLTMKPDPPRAIVNQKGNADFTLHFKRVNVGNRPADRSVTEVHIDGLGEVSGHGAGGLRPGRSETDKFDGPFLLSGRNSSGLGFRKVWVCADAGGGRHGDVNETNERNNCSGKVSFPAVPKTWLVNKFTRDGSWSETSGGGETATYEIHTFTGVMNFDFAGIFTDPTGTTNLVWIASGGVNETQSGHTYTYSEPGDPNYCPQHDYSGRVGVEHSPWGLDVPFGRLEVSFDDLATYSALIWDSDLTYPLTSAITCSGSNSQGYDYMKSLEFGAALGGTQDFHPQARVQSGQYFDHGQATEPPGDFLTSWSLKAEVPGGQ
jgi:hypothetical protein